MTIDEIKKEYEEKFTTPNPLGSGKTQSKLFQAYPDEVWAFIEQIISAIGAESFELGAKACREYYDHNLDEVRQVVRQKAIDDCINVISTYRYPKGNLCHETYDVLFDIHQAMTALKDGKDGK